MSIPRTLRRPLQAVFAFFPAVALMAGALLLPSAFGQNGVNPLGLYQNYFVTGDYVVAGWVEGAPDGSGFAPGVISIPDTLQPAQPGVPATVPVGADIVAAYLYWATVEGSQSSFAGQAAYFNGYRITGTVLGNPNAPTSWSSGGCSGSSLGSKTMRTYRADVHPYLPIDQDANSPTFGATIANGKIPLRLTDSGSNGNTAPFALGATLVVIYRVLHPATPLNAIVLYDGAFAPSNTSQTVSQTMMGFYQPSANPVAKLTHIVANGQPNKKELVYLNSTAQPLNSIYGSLPPFPGVYTSNGSAWDNPTWVIGNGNGYGYGYVKNADTQETTSVVPAKNNSGCVSWGATIVSTTVQDTDGDGLLDAWEQNQGYADVVRGMDVGVPMDGQWVALPGADPAVKDIFVELDYLNDLNPYAGSTAHTHLPKKDAIDTVAAAFSNQGIRVHFDLGAGIYQDDTGGNVNNSLGLPINSPVIAYPVAIPNPLPAGAAAPQAGTGGNSISEAQLLCTDGPGLCTYPGQPATGWKAGFEAIKSNAALGNFQPGRDKSYHYILFGHSLGTPRSFWSTIATVWGAPSIPQLISIVNTGNAATVTLQSPQGVTKPGDCAVAGVQGCADVNNDRVTITGALGQTALNGSYHFTVLSTNTVNQITTTKLSIATSGVTSGTYTFTNEPQLGVTYLGPTSTSGQSEFGGGGDSAVTLGLWGADDPTTAPLCQPDPTQALTANQVYCSSQVGTTGEQAGTLMHELGHSLSLTHGGAYYLDANNPSLATYEVNCKANYLSVMNYLFQVRGFVDGGYDYSTQRLGPVAGPNAEPILSETALSEGTGVGTDADTGNTAAHLTRWYSAPNALDTMLQKASGGRYASSHCDGTPLAPNAAPAVRVDGYLTAGGTYSAPLDWNNDLVAGDAVQAPGIDINYNGTIGDPAFSGFSDWPVLNLQQVGARENAFGYSGGGVKAPGSGVKAPGSGVDNDGGGVKAPGSGVKAPGSGVKAPGSGIDQNEDVATSTADAPVSLICTLAVNGVPSCTGSGGAFVENARSVPLSWTAPTFGQTRTYTVWRAVGGFSSAQQVAAHMSAFSVVKTLSGTPPATSWTDPNVKNNTTYTYFVTDNNKQGAQSGPSNPLVVTVKF